MLTISSLQTNITVTAIQVGFLTEVWDQDTESQ